MRLITKYYYIDEIPVIEMVQDGLDNKPAPLVIFYHGFSNTKDGMMTYGNEVAKKGFRVIMPDAKHHGERRAFGLDYNANGLVFFEAIKTNIEEFPKITHHFSSKDLIQDDFIGVAGMSMGGMTSSLLTRSNSNINATVILMGTPQQEVFNNWLINQYISQIEDSLPVNEYAKTMYDQMTQFFQLHDLGQSREAIASRPILFWHSKQDPVVPYTFTEEFVQQVSQTEEGKYVYLKLDDGGGHKVPYKEMARMAEFFSASLTEDRENIFNKTESEMKKRFG